MDELAIREYLENNKATEDYFIDVLSYEELCIFPRENKKYFYIVNTGKANTVGKHWVVLFKTSSGSIEFFDPLGKHPSDYSPEITQFIFQNANSFLKSDKRIQGSKNVCGFYCLLYSFFRCKGKSMDYFLNLFSDNLEKNDILVEM